MRLRFRHDSEIKNSGTFPNRNFPIRKEILKMRGTKRSAFRSKTFGTASSAEFNVAGEGKL